MKAAMSGDRCVTRVCCGLCHPEVLSAGSLCVSDHGQEAWFPHRREACETVRVSPPHSFGQRSRAMSMLIGADVAPCPTLTGQLGN